MGITLEELPRKGDLIEITVTPFDSVEYCTLLEEPVVKPYAIPGSSRHMQAVSLVLMHHNGHFRGTIRTTTFEEWELKFMNVIKGACTQSQAVQDGS